MREYCVQGDDKNEKEKGIKKNIRVRLRRIEGDEDKEGWGEEEERG